MREKRSGGICIYFSHEVYPVKGGISRVTSLLADFFEKKGFRVYFLSSRKIYGDFSAPANQYFINPRDGDRFLSFLKEKEIKFFIDQSAGVPKFPYPLPPKEIVFISVLHFRPYFYSEDVLAEKMKSNSLLKRIPFKKMFYDNSFLKKVFSIVLKFRLRRLYGESVRHSDRFLLLSDSYKEELKNLLKEKELPKSVHVITNPCSFAGKSVNLGNKEKEIIWVGRVEYAFKRPDLLLKIWQKIQDAFPDWRVRFIGDGSYLSELKNLAFSLKVKRVYFEGFRDPVTFYQKASILCMTSLSEGVPMVLMEASVYGCVPVLFNSFSSASDIIKNDENGFLIRPFSLTDYADSLKKLMSSEDYRSKIAASAEKNANRFSLLEIGGKWIDMFESVCREKDILRD